MLTPNQDAQLRELSGFMESMQTKIRTLEEQLGSQAHAQHQAPHKRDQQSVVSQTAPLPLPSPATTAAEAGWSASGSHTTPRAKRGCCWSLLSLVAWLVRLAGFTLLLAAAVGFGVRIGHASTRYRESAHSGVATPAAVDWSNEAKLAVDDLLQWLHATAPATMDLVHYVTVIDIEPGLSEPEERLCIQVAHRYRLPFALCWTPPIMPFFNEPKTGSSGVSANAIDSPLGSDDSASVSVDAFGQVEPTVQPVEAASVAPAPPSPCAVSTVPTRKRRVV
jgi:hypothetical protein